MHHIANSIQSSYRRIRSYREELEVDAMDNSILHHHVPGASILDV